MESLIEVLWAMWSHAKWLWYHVWCIRFLILLLNQFLKVLSEILEIAKIIKNNISLDILRQNIFPDRPEEAAMFGCESLST